MRLRLFTFVTPETKPALPGVGDERHHVFLCFAAPTLEPFDGPQFGCSERPANGRFNR